MNNVLFVNYLSSNTKDISKYRKQHGLFVATALYNQPNGKCSIINGEKGDDRFIEALTELQKAKETVDYPVMYLDNDCVLMNRVDALFDDYDFDVAVVYRYQFEEAGGRQDCLGGFLYFSQQRKDAEKHFLDKLTKRTEERYWIEKDSGKEPWWYDQLAINDIVGEPERVRTQKEYYLSVPYEPCPKDIDGVKILFLSANEWACPSTFIFTPTVYIFHYNHRLWFNAANNSAIRSEEITEQ